MYVYVESSYVKDLYLLAEVAEVPGISREILKTLPLLPLGYQCVSSKNVNLFGTAVWPAIGNIYTNIYMSEELYYMDRWR